MISEMVDFRSSLLSRTAVDTCKSTNQTVLRRLLPAIFNAGLVSARASNSDRAVSGTHLTTT